MLQGEGKGGADWSGPAISGERQKFGTTFIRRKESKELTLGGKEKKVLGKGTVHEGEAALRMPRLTSEVI